MYTQIIISKLAYYLIMILHYTAAVDSFSVSGLTTATLLSEKEWNNKK